MLVCWFDNDEIDILKSLENIFDELNYNDNKEEMDW